MFSKIMIPVDLRHLDELQKSLKAGGELAKLWNAPITYVSVTTEQPSSIAHNRQEFQEKLDKFAKDQADQLGVETSAKGIASHDPAVDLDDTLLKAADEIGADLVVMQSHIPNLADYIWPSNGGTVARRARISVMIVRDA